MPHSLPGVIAASCAVAANLRPLLPKRPLALSLCAGDEQDGSLQTRVLEPDLYLPAVARICRCPQLDAAAARIEGHASHYQDG
jgi:hypothetical protein